MTIRRARPEEAAALSALAVRSKASWGYDEAFMKACVDELGVSADFVRRHPVYVIEEGRRLLGFYTLEPLADGEVELGHLFVEPGAFRRGCGTRLLEHARTTARAAGHAVLVIQGDPNAEGFYRAMGAAKIGARPSASIPGRELPLFRIAL
jgi:GNAT superfamily N-acetyltransferase